MLGIWMVSVIRIKKIDYVLCTVLLQQITAIHSDSDIISELYHSRVSKHVISSGSFLFSFKCAKFISL